MFRRKKVEADPDARFTELERVVDLQGFILLVVGVVAGISVGVAAVLFMQQGSVNFDHIAVSLTIFQTLFGIAALYGFWALRGLTRDRAEEVAQEVTRQIALEQVSDIAERVATAEIRSIGPSLILREVKSYLETFRGETTISDDAMERLMAALDRKEDGNG